MQFRSEADKWSVAGFTQVASARIRPGGIAECPLPMEAIVKSLYSVEDEPEGFTVIVTRIKAVHAHEDVVTFPPPDYAAVRSEVGRRRRSGCVNAGGS